MVTLLIFDLDGLLVDSQSLQYKAYNTVFSKYGHPISREDWEEYSHGLISASKQALKAATSEDSEALFDAGGRIYQVCLACHSQYLIEIDETDG